MRFGGWKHSSLLFWFDQSRVNSPVSKEAERIHQNALAINFFIDMHLCADICSECITTASSDDEQRETETIKTL